MRKYGVIGLGQVGATVAYTLVQQGIVDELVLIDKNEALAKAQKLDLDDASPRLSSTTKIILNDYDALADAEVLIVASGNIGAIDMNSSKGRFGEYDLNQAIVRDIAPKIVASGFKGILIDIMNPCDVMTDYLQRMTGFPRNRVFGTGTFLDTARMQKYVGQATGTNGKNVSGYVYGEHGNSQFVAWSTVSVNGQPIKKFPGLNLDQLEEDARQGAFAVMAGKHYTNFAIATCGVRLAEAVSADAQLACPVSAFDPQFGTYVGMPAVIGKNGIESLIQLELTADEQASLAASAKFIKSQVDVLPGAEVNA
ncbi:MULTISPECIES: L-lactate dehydrogenase [Lactiplantibacillus]|jgi:L-lactate dehydrogenase|uniref:L-lactate dehydrogenase n=4 Tax=Lactiplantibacillus pentosus TaxID=1589 RepID=A0A241RT46_LACPE|nr:MULTISPECIES: L-lactate dehydrogenase [Lactiplantibacillus]CCC18517.1 L-2-hydroxyisocaproate dehydrogenase [Lactiplantibacillus pentosus IG1]ASG80848.1 L-lactate dehydrogenase [Lactiplantibacillus pentosus]AUI78235.1 L-lactate dehydrogenase [Lactiplantibacillus pentosus]AYJ42408.1 L-lactate dehydrogenase [Lactiplantibacillus pentosus]KRK24476.1 l-2-hydroxyisocaproate dehydrogenase [Lactiplantibacillus pentosus DSM 20314]